MIPQAVPLPIALYAAAQILKACEPVTQNNLISPLPLPTYLPNKRYLPYISFLRNELNL